MKITIWTFLIFIICSCDNNPYDCALDQSVLSRNDSILALPNDKDGFKRILLEYDEPELESLDHKAYRLVITYSWDRDTWIYRFEKTEDGGILTLKKNYVESFQETVGISDTIIRKELSVLKWNEIEETFDANCFWTLPISIDRRGLDGRTCILEAFDPNRNNPVSKSYFIAGRWSPEENTEFWKICDYIESFEQDPEWAY